MQPAGRVGDDQVRAASDGGVEGVVDDGTRIGARSVGNDRDAGTVRPDPELVDRRGAERIGGRQDHAAALGGVPAGQLADRRRLARPVDADDEHDGGPVAASPVVASSARSRGTSRAASSARMAASGPPGSRRDRARSTSSMASAAPTSPAMSVSSTSSQAGPPSSPPRKPRSLDMNLPRVRWRPASRPDRRRGVRRRRGSSTDSRRSGAVTGMLETGSGPGSQHARDRFSVLEVGRIGFAGSAAVSDRRRRPRRRLRARRVRRGVVARTACPPA